MAPTDEEVEVRQIIAEALFQYSEGRDALERGRTPWGRERSEWRADAVLQALNGFGFAVTARLRQQEGGENG